MRFSKIIVLGCLAALFLHIALAWQLRWRVLSGANDFLMFYAGARLAGTPGLYDPDRVREVQLESAGVTGPNLLFTRLPYVAVLAQPLAWLPYRTAYGVWQLLAAGALAGFLALWRTMSLPLTTLFCCLSTPLFVSFLNGQDLTFLLLWIALAVWLYRKRNTFAAGLIFALCFAKYHLFVLLPVLILGQKLRRFGQGTAVGGAVLLGLCFATSGLTWPRDYYRILTNPKSLEGVSQMPNLHGLFFGWPGSLLLEGLLAAGVVVMTWRVVRRTTFEWGLAATLAGSLLLSFHAYVADAVVLLPAALTIYSSSTGPWLRLLCLFLLTPIGYLLSLSSVPPLTAVVPVAVLLLLSSMASPVARQASSDSRGTGS
jgi:hypothetical protein